MKAILLALSMTVFSVNSMAQNYSRFMPRICEEKLKQELHDSLYGDTTWLVEQIKSYWAQSPKSNLAKFETCGSSDFLLIEVDKKDCKIIYYSEGDSDGECDQRL